MLQSDISKTVDTILDNQAANAIGEGVTPVKHISAYEVNLRMLERVKKDVGRIENFVLASGQDPEGLIGESEDTPEPRKIHMRPEDYKEIVFQISVKNSSPSALRNIDLKRDLPDEINVDDVLDAGDLSVARDIKRNITYVFSKKKVKLAPNQTKTYDIKIRDKWNVNEPRISSLQSRIKDVVGSIGEKGQYKSVDDDLKILERKLISIRNEEGPAELGADYVAFYRDQTRRLDSLEQEIFRIEASLRPVDKKAKRGFKVQPPSLKTTWLVIWSILGFLGVMSLIFFLRWMGRGKDEKIVNSE